MRAGGPEQVPKRETTLMFCLFLSNSEIVQNNNAARLQGRLESCAPPP